MECRDWDLWGPLVLCLVLGILLSANVSQLLTPQRTQRHIGYCRLQAPPSQSLAVFTSVVVIISLGSLVVTVQAKVRVTFLRSYFIAIEVCCPSAPWWKSVRQGN